MDFGYVRQPRKDHSFYKPCLNIPACLGLCCLLALFAGCSLSESPGPEAVAPPPAKTKARPAPAEKPAPVKSRIAKKPVGDLAPHMVKAYALNLRACPGTGCAVLKVLKKGEVVQPLFRSGSWLEVKTRGGGTGWVSAKYLKTAPAPKKRLKPLITPERPTAPPAPAEEFSQPSKAHQGKIKQVPKINEEFTP